MTDVLEQQLIQLCNRVDVSRQHSLVSDVLTRLPRKQGRRRVRTLVVGFAVAAAGLIVVPGSRHAIAGWLTFGKTRIERSPAATSMSEQTPTSNRSVITPGTGAVTGAVTGAANERAPFNLGPGLEQVTASEAKTRTGLAVPVLSDSPPPAAILVTSAPDLAQVLVVYGPSKDLGDTTITGVGGVLSTVGARAETATFGKFLGDGTTFENVQVTTSTGDVVAGVWIAGEPHRYGLLAPNGEFVVDTLRLATNTLLWVQADTQYRLEAHISRVEALTLAASVKLAP